MAKRSNGEGTIYKRKDGIWCASRYVPCGNGKFKRKYVYGKTQKSVKEKLKELENYEEPKAQTTTLVGRMLEWMEQYKKNVLKIPLMKIIWDIFGSMCRGVTLPISH